MSSNLRKISQETRKYGSFKREKKSTDTVPEQDLMADLLHKGFKAIERTKGRCGQSQGNNVRNKMDPPLKRNSGAEKHNN